MCFLKIAKVKKKRLYPPLDIVCDRINKKGFFLGLLTVAITDQFLVVRKIIIPKAFIAKYATLQEMMYKNCIFLQINSLLCLDNNKIRFVNFVKILKF